MEEEAWNRPLSQAVTARMRWDRSTYSWALREKSGGNQTHPKARSRKLAGRAGKIFAMDVAPRARGSASGTHTVVLNSRQTAEAAVDVEQQTEVT